MFARLSLLAVAGAILLGLTACYESPDVTVFKPGLYKGKKDPLVAMQRSAEQQRRLRERFDRIQMDR